MIKLADIFKSGMTLQRDKDFKIYGVADGDTEVSVFVNGECVADCQVTKGEFVLVCKSQPALFSAEVVVEFGEDKITLSDVDFGDVYVAGGQSNMEFLVRNEMHYKEAVRGANDPHLRFYDVPKYAFVGEEKDGFKIKDEYGIWKKAMGREIDKFSAVGYYFAKELRAKYNVPVAIVGCNWSGTTASSWLDVKYLKEDKDLCVYINEYEKAIDGLDLAEYEKLDYKVRKGANSLIQRLFWGAVLRRTSKVLLSISGIFGQGVGVGPHSTRRPGCLYENMVKKIKDLCVKGVIWYQGESDENHADIYDKLFGAVIECWRESFKDDLPFLFVQLAPFSYWLASRGHNFPLVREKQALVSKTVPGVYMASIMDAGDEDDIHPKDKKTVGERLALLAMGKIYGEDIICEPPVPAASEIKENKIEIQFNNCHRLNIVGEKVNDLTVTDKDGDVAIKTTKTKGNTLIIEVERPLVYATVSFAKSPYCKANLYSDSGLCAAPFMLNAGV